MGIIFTVVVHRASSFVPLILSKVLISPLKSNQSGPLPSGVNTMKRWPCSTKMLPSSRKRLTPP